jgi:hypothetical protein
MSWVLTVLAYWCVVAMVVGLLIAVVFGGGSRAERFASWALGDRRREPAAAGSRRRASCDAEHRADRERVR